MKITPKEKEYLEKTLEKFSMDIFDYITPCGLHGLRDKVNDASSHLKDISFLWNMEYEGEFHEFQCDTKEEAEKAADEWWDDKCSYADYSYTNGETVEDWCKITCTCYDDKSGVEHVVISEDYMLEWEYYHGDKKEHGYP